jgi:hypothetical protein
VIFVGIMDERDHVDTKVGCPVPNWNDWKADAVQLKKILIYRVWSANLKQLTYESGRSEDRYYSQRH